MSEAFPCPNSSKVQTASASLPQYLRNASSFGSDGPPRRHAWDRDIYH